MPCTLFDDGRLARCTGVEGLLIPSHHERERYCRTDESRDCPTFKLYKLHGRPVPQEAYYALWVPPAPPVRATAADELDPIAVAL